MDVRRYLPKDGWFGCGLLDMCKLVVVLTSLIASQVRTSVGLMA